MLPQWRRKTDEIDFRRHRLAGYLISASGPCEAVGIWLEM